MTEQTPYVTVKSRNHTKITKLSNKDIIQKLFSLNKSSGFNWSHTNNSVFIVGSVIYKNYLRNEPIDDIDVITSKPPKVISTLFKEIELSAYNPDIKDDDNKSSFNMETTSDYSTIKFFGTSAIKLDLVSISYFNNLININGLSMINCLVLTETGIKHVLEVKDISQHIDFETKDAVLEREWAINKIKNGEYCVTHNMRNKDKEYFRNWKRIDPVECALHGMFSHKKN
ncbi:MAG: hypothetical protein Barrevirus1_14 [Barrevirus sp.]|uniref:Uncharacterized protein n=1 Tax=Barrevirus sp. TaxID=2487763 RepID=A0A3G4ZPG1_9VIRU|nr:MAG: hypothetical protein Barrevirus1_14 [Barrevirus sp.]